MTRTTDDYAHVLKNCKGSSPMNETAPPMQCPACNGQRATPWGSEGKTKIVVCEKCGTTFFPRPIAQANDYKSYYPYLSDFDEGRAIAEREVRRKQCEAKLHIMTAMLGKPSLRILDIGSGPGYFGAIAAQAGHSVTCGEINPDAAAFGKKWFGLKFENLFHLEPGAFDVVSFFHVIEHLEYPDHFFSTAIELLVPDGLMYVHVPRHETTSSRVELSLKKLAGLNPDRRGCLHLPDHFTGFTDQGLAAFAARFGLEEVRVKHLSMLSPEFDPLFFRFKAKSPKSLALLAIDLLRGGMDAGAGGTWLRLTAHKPKG